MNLVNLIISHLIQTLNNKYDLIKIFYCNKITITLKQGILKKIKDCLIY